MAALNPTFVQPVASSIPSGDVTGGHPSRSRFKDSLFIVRKSFLYLAFGAMFFFIMLQINVICLDLCTYFLLRWDHGEHPGHAPASWWVCLARVR